MEIDRIHISSSFSKVLVLNLISVQIVEVDFEFYRLCFKLQQQNYNFRGSSR
jgi:hypothetical protein